MKITLDAEPGEPAAKAHDLIKALAVELAPASASARAALDALEEIEVDKRAERPMRNAELEKLRKRMMSIAVEELTALFREIPEALSDDEPLEKAMFLGPKGGKWADPEHTISWREESGEPQHAAAKEVVVRPHKALGFHSAQMRYRVHEGDDEHVTLKPHDGLGSSIRMPKRSLQHFVDDLHGVVSGPETDDPHIGAVLSGKAKLLGKGHEGLAFKHGPKVVKVSTTVPFHPENQGHRTPEDAARQTMGEAHAASQLRALGVPNILEMQAKRHGEKGFLVRDHVDLPEKFNDKQLGQIADAIHGMHRNGWGLHDQIQAGVDAEGDAKLFDVGHAAPSDPKQRAGDFDNLRQLFRAHGKDYDPPPDLEDIGGEEPETFLKTHTSDKRMMIMRSPPAAAKRWERKALAAFERLRQTARETFHDMPEDLAEELEAIDARERETINKFVDTAPTIALPKTDHLTSTAQASGGDN